MSWIRESTLSCFQYIAVKIIKSGIVPRHIALIMDGNRRFAKKNSVRHVEGHTRGFDKLSETLQWCLDLGVQEVTVYAFSIENFKRTKEEVDDLIELSRQKFQRLLDEQDKLMEHGVCIRIIGNLTLIPMDVRKLIAKAMLITRQNDKVFLNVAFAYTSRDEITNAIRDVVYGIKSDDILPDVVDEDLISKCLYTCHSPDPELLIRTSGEVRLSDFLMWQSTGTYLYFAEVLWPEFSIWDLLSAVFHYQRFRAKLEKISKDNSITSVINNNKVVSFIDKLYLERQTALENYAAVKT